MAVALGLLGEVTAHIDGRAVELGPPRQRCVLAALTVDAGRVVPVEQLMQRVWGADTPRRGRETLHSHISRLRHALVVADGVAIVLRSGGYALVVDQAERAVDLHRFRDLCARARGADDAHAVALLTEAVALPRGEPLTGLSGQWAEAERDRLRQELLSARHDLVDARLRVGDGEELVVELAARTAQHPLDERVAGQYLLALHRAGRSADALEHYQRLRERLVEELGTDPSDPLQQLHQRILAADSSLSAPSGGGKVEPAVVPRQLPAAPPHFVGRDTDLAALTATLAEAEQGRTVVISAIGGAGGIGKTWLAVHWANRHRDRFPDGQLFVDLRGFSPDGAPMAPIVAVRGFLDALGADPGRIPVDPQAQAGLLRSLLAQKRMLIVLDNAADAEQVAPLLPGGDSCTVVVTSRRTLTGLITRNGAHHLALDTLSGDEARAFLTRRLGAARVAAEPKAVEELIGLCGGFPLALGIIASRAHTHPHVPLAEFGADLRNLGLGALEDDDPTANLPTVLSWSYRTLTTQQQIMFGLLGIAPGPDITLPAAASLTSLPADQAAKVLRDLEEASLLSRDTHGRFAMHDLIRHYATNTAHKQLSHDVRDAALRRVVDFYLHTAHTADRLLHPHRDPIRLDPPAPRADPHLLPDDSAALAWMDIHHPHLLAAQHIAAAHHRHQAVWHLAWVLTTFHRRRGHRHDALAVWQAAADAADHLSDPTTRISIQRFIGLAHAELEQHGQAIGHLHQALALAKHHHEPAEQAHTHQILAWVWELRGDGRESLKHARHALGHYRALDQPVWEADALNGVGWAAARLGDYDTARDHCQAALTLHQHHHDPDGEAATLDSLGFIEHHAGHPYQAIHHYQQSLTLLRTLGNTVRAADTLDNLGHPHAACGQHRQARLVWQEALELYRDQERGEDADRVQRQLDALQTHEDGDQPAPPADSPS
ncbi:transcriptional regulator, SARP family protein [Lentzea tibetensis]|uniref:Transcriptional regulator, SARP family protein n=1 Tax=Lentzea tibetensis TaxID=2591470 RepID=A0A563F2M7_9PSEU|nr:BTAD domain-containing putative transcriptional regulator [Lentzea tibetensis]TWP54011.1 transcriptional regulator, SARP family protein [Lentzea tibetensis]